MVTNSFYFNFYAYLHIVKVSKIEPLVLIADTLIKLESISTIKKWNLSIGGTITPFLSLYLFLSFSPAPPEITCGIVDPGTILLE